MTMEEIINYCLSKSGAYIDFPFGDIPICIKVQKRLFAQMYPRKDDYKITLNCDRLTGEIYRNTYTDTVVRGYHCPLMLQPYFNTVYLDGTISDDELKVMIDHSYLTVVGKLPKKVQKELFNDQIGGFTSKGWGECTEYRGSHKIKGAEIRPFGALKKLLIMKT